MTIELLACPFCGGDAEFEKRPAYAVAICPQCRIRTAEYYDREVAAKVWNTRTTPTPTPLSLEQLEQMDGEPVWVEWIMPSGEERGKFDKDEWALIYGPQEMAESTTTTYRFEYYDITWRSYTTKPAGKEGEGVDDSDLVARMDAMSEEERDRVRKEFANYEQTWVDPGTDNPLIEAFNRGRNRRTGHMGDEH